MITMNIRQAARWAERKGALYTVNRYTGEPQYLYAVYDTRNNMVECIGAHPKCAAYLHSLGAAHDRMQTRDGRWLRLQALDEVAQELDDAEGEQNCLPSSREVAWGAA